jgi:hypothetical protein
MRMGSVIRYGPGSSKTRTLNQKVETSLLSYLIRLLRQLPTRMPCSIVESKEMCVCWALIFLCPNHVTSVFQALV